MKKDEPEAEAREKEESAAKPTRSSPEAYFLPGRDANLKSRPVWIKM